MRVMVSAMLTKLREGVRKFPSALLGYSGGVDSALLAIVLREELGPARMLAVIGRSASWEGAIPGRPGAGKPAQDPVVGGDPRARDRPIANATNRCFFCKTELWGRLRLIARERGIAVVCDGTNADDLAPGEHRPGHAAGIAAGVLAPLAEAGMGKAAVRDAARALGLPVWDAPAAPCLSSRVRYGVRITPRRLRQVEEAEARQLGVDGDLRVRHHGDRARIEAEAPWIAFLSERMDAVRERLPGLGFGSVEVDPRGYRRGSLLPTGGR
jgi:uncharacterized protein